MKKYIFKVLPLLCLIVLFSVGCSMLNSSKLKLDGGVLSWKADKKAAYYEVTIGDISTVSEKENIHLSKVCEFAGKHTITVSSVSDDNKKKEIGTMDVEVVALEKPAVSITEADDGKTSFTWKAQEGVQYSYNLHDGYGAQPAKDIENGIYEVVMDNNNSTIFTVITEGDSKDNIFYMGNETRYRYQGKMLFNMSDMIKYPFYTVSAGLGLDTLQFGTTLKKGLYDLEMSFYLMDVNGASLEGDGRWGRRIWNIQPQGEQLIWFCEKQIEKYEESANTLPTADKMVTTKVEQVEIDQYGEAILDLADFNVNEMIVVADIKLNGKSVMASGLKDRSDEVIFDVAKLKDFHAVYQSKGSYYSLAPEDSVFEIPVDLKDGVYEIELSYQLMDGNGKALRGNGMWGRRITNGTVDDAELVWYCDYAFEPHTPGDNIPLPTKTMKSVFTGKVEKGIFKITCLDFNSKEIMAVSAVKKLSGSSARFNLSTLKNYKYIHKDKAEYDPNNPEELVVETTISERNLYNVELIYYVMDKNGYMLIGNGMWGRRIMTDSEEETWVCHSAPHEAHADAIGTVAEPTKAIKKTVQVAINKKGKFTLYMHDFKEGEMVVVKDVKYQGKSILK